MAETPSSGLTPPEPHPQAGHRSGDDDLLIDVAGFARLLWRFRFAILVTTMVGGAIGAISARSVPPTFLGRAVITLTLSPGTAPAAAQMARFQALAGDLAVIASALKDAGLEELTSSRVQSVTTTKMGQPSSLLIVETQWPDAEIAGRVASAVASRALTTLRARWEKETSDTVAAREKELADAEQQFQVARAAFGNSWLRRPSIAGLELESDPRGRQLEGILAEIPPTWARLESARARFSEIPPASQVVESAAARAVMIETEMRLAELESRREILLLSISRRRPLEEILKEWSEFDARNRALHDAMGAARLRVGALAKALKMAREITSQTVGLELVEPSFSPGRRISVGASAFVARGMASGLVLAVFAVFFVRGMLANMFGRRI